MEVDYIKHTLHFHLPAGTSRGILTSKDSWIIRIKESSPQLVGYGECSVINGLSPDFPPAIEGRIQKTRTELEQGIPFSDLDFEGFPALKFAFETALLDLNTKGAHLLFPSSFTKGKSGIPINGLVWMGDSEFMLNQVSQKIADGFSCLKLKIGAIDLEEEIAILQDIRESYPTSELEIRLDANGAFTPENVMGKLDRLAAFDIHSIEQPISVGQWKAMAKICAESPIPVALDEELIGVQHINDRKEMLDVIDPPFIILKPSLLGGILETREWIDLAQMRGLGWWITSALEGNIGLNAIAQFCSTLKTSLPQGLGTGRLFSNNLQSPLEIKAGALHYNPSTPWTDVNALFP